MHLLTRLLTVILTLTAASLLAQPSTDVYLFDLDTTGDFAVISNPINISNNPGYDNQPQFLPDGSGVLFAATRNGQTDIRKYDIASGLKTWITETAGSEYSPTPMPSGSSVSAIVLEEDGRQLLWQYPLGGGEGKVLVPLVKIGYHAWLDQSTLFAFVLGPRSTFQKINLTNQTAEAIGENIGRSLHKIPGTDKISIVDKSADLWQIQIFDPTTGEFEAIAVTPKGAEDMTWLNNGSILIGDGSKILQWQKGASTWKLCADLATFDLEGITRLAVDPTNTKLAVVVSEN